MDSTFAIRKVGSVDSNENTNGPLRQYVSKGTDLSVYTMAQLNTVARQSRKALGFKPSRTI
jgi:IS30 family transposase